LAKRIATPIEKQPGLFGRRRLAGCRPQGAVQSAGNPLLAALVGRLDPGDLSCAKRLKAKQRVGDGRLESSPLIGVLRNTFNGGYLYHIMECAGRRTISRIREDDLTGATSA
jgi:hypothetical protein